MPQITTSPIVIPNIAGQRVTRKRAAMPLGAFASQTDRVQWTKTLGGACVHAVDDTSPAGYLIEVEYVLARSPARRARCGALRLRRFRERPRPADWPSPREAASGVRCGGGRGRCRASDAGVVCLRCGALCPGVCQHRSAARDRRDGLRCAVAHRPRQSSRTRVERAPVSPRQVKDRGVLVNVLRVSCGAAETPRHAHMRGQVALESHVLSVEPHQRQCRSG